MNRIFDPVVAQARLELMIHQRQDLKWSMRQMARFHNISAERVRQILDEIGLAGHIKLADQVDVENAVLNWLINDLTGESLRQFALRLGRSPAYITRTARKLGWRPQHEYLHSLGKRRCYRCFEVKSLDEYGQDRTDKYGLMHTCKVCNRKQARKYYTPVMERS